MKKFFLLIFITFCGLIFYQIVLGKNGLIEGYRVQKDKERLVRYKLLLQKKNKDLEDQIKYLKNDPDALRSFAAELGFFDGEVKLVKILDDIEKSGKLDIDVKEGIDIDKLINENEKSTAIDLQIKKLRMWISVIFYLFFGFFIVLIIFGVQKKDE
jgi:hypothetical protein